ncbi:type IV toxin-antitoxin system AbiEi family antitoxin [Microbacterium invictum]|uniref:Type IV toxin-antitoxin system AbiEi family antitoxin n=1 Tax=Microbacterium invictum TaxID=515415 RepID=A0ABZ0VA63_9MICO|nr:type IV toxin-antitoxin system AbiEi family antitoxin [Microbacterium invictum]WQB69000.1 type IV toxin-antitoxin system AbiEi family antitoxin [Microbacterium invictum]
MATSRFLYLPGDRLSTAELSAARLDGDVVEVGDGYMPADAVETAALRAGSLAGILTDLFAATHLSAAWIHGAIAEPPARHYVQRAVARRVSAVHDRRVVVRDTALARSDLDRVGGVWVTTPERTLADLCRMDDDPHRRAAGELSRLRPGLAARTHAHLSGRGRVPHKRRALRLLEDLAV